LPIRAGEKPPNQPKTQKKDKKGEKEGRKKRKRAGRIHTERKKKEDHIGA